MSDELKQAADHYSEVEKKVAELKEKLTGLAEDVQETVEREDRKYSIPDFKRSKEPDRSLDDLKTKTGDTVSRTFSGTVEKLGDFYDRNLKETVESAAGKAKSAAEDAYNTLSIKISDLREGSKEPTEEAADKARTALTGLAGSVKEKLDGIDADELKNTLAETGSKVRTYAEQAYKTINEKLSGKDPEDPKDAE